MKKQEERHIVDILFVAGLFCIFALSAIFLITIGANIYGHTVTNMEDNFNSRTSFAYLAEKIRQADSSGSVDVDVLDGAPALKLTAIQNNTTYLTWIYAYDGYLKELMVREDLPLPLSAGQNILTLSDFSAKKISDTLFQFTLTDDQGITNTMLISLKSDSTLKKGAPYEN